jgi:type I restriction-modification system DNA methylase subunit
LAARKNGSDSAPNSDRTTTPSTSARTFNGFSEIVSLIWSVADLLRGNYKQADYGMAILSMRVFRRLDCVLAGTKAQVLAKHDALPPSASSESPVRASPDRRSV